MPFSPADLCLFYRLSAVGGHPRRVSIFWIRNQDRDRHLLRSKLPILNGDEGDMTAINDGWFVAMDHIFNRFCSPVDEPDSQEDEADMSSSFSAE